MNYTDGVEFDNIETYTTFLCSLFGSMLKLCNYTIFINM